MSEKKEFTEEQIQKFETPIGRNVKSLTCFAIVKRVIPSMSLERGERTLVYAVPLRFSVKPDFIKDCWLCVSEVLTDDKKVMPHFIKVYQKYQFATQQTPLTETEGSPIKIEKFKSIALRIKLLFTHS